MESNRADRESSTQADRSRDCCIGALHIDVPGADVQRCAMDVEAGGIRRDDVPCVISVAYLVPHCTEGILPYAA